jgi:cytoskeletal protein CcmA (bactofilin family)
MLNVRCRQWLVIALPTAMALIALFLSGSGQLLAGITPAVMAASRSANIAQNECTSTHQEPSFGGTIVVETNEIACGNLTTFGGTVAINGEVRGDIVAFTSSVVIAGTVDGNIQLYGGRVILQSGSRVFGDIHLYGGQVVEGLNAQLQGSVIDHTKRVDWLFTDNGAFRFSFWSLLIWVALGILLTSVLPEHVMLVRTTVVSKTRRSLVIGLLSVLLAPAVLIVLIALVLSIPLAIIVGLGLVAAWALGTVAVGWLVGDYIMRRVAPQHNTRLIQIVVGLTALVLAGSLPYIGWLISIGVGLLGLGAVFLSRFGTRLYSQPKQPLIL